MAANSFAVLAVAALSASLSLAADPGMYSRGGNLYMEVEDGKSIIVKTGDTETDLLAELDGLTKSITDFETDLTETVNKAMNRKVVIKEFDVKVQQPQPMNVPIGLLASNQAINLFMSIQGCGTGYGFSVDVVSAFGETRAPEAFMLGSAARDESLWTFKHVPVNDTHYWLFVVYDTTKDVWCHDNTEGPSYALKARVTINSNSPLPEFTDAELDRISPDSQGKPVALLSLEGLQKKLDSLNVYQIAGKYSSNPPADKVKNVNHALGDEGNLAKGSYSNADGAFLVGKFKAHQTLNIDIEDQGQCRNLGMSFTVVAHSCFNDENYACAPKAYYFGHAGRDKWINPATGITFKWQKDSGNAYWLWLYLPNQIKQFKKDGADADGCSNSGDFYQHTVNIRYQTSSPPAPYEDADVPNFSPKQLTDVAMTSLQEVDEQVRGLSRTIDVSWSANNGDAAGLAGSSPDVNDLMLGKFNSSQILDITLELRGCGQTFGAHMNVVARHGFTSTNPDATWLTAPEAFMFGTAAKDTSMDGIQLYWQAVDEHPSFYWLWLQVNGPASACKAASNNAVTVNTKVSTPFLEYDNVPKITAKYLQPTDTLRKQVKRISIEDIARKLDPESPELRSTIQSAFNMQVFDKDVYRTNYEKGKTSDDLALLKYLGKFKVQSVVHIDVSDAGMSSDIGIFFNVVARWGVAGASTPESYMFGAANDNAASHVSLKFKAISNVEYELYLAVTHFTSTAKTGPNRKCENVDSSAVCDYLNHTASVTLRSSAKLVDAESSCKVVNGKIDVSCAGVKDMPLLSVKSIDQVVEAMAPKTIEFKDDFKASKGFSTGERYTVTDYGDLNRKVIKILYTGNDVMKKDIPEQFSMQVPIGLMKTSQPVHITVQDSGWGSTVGHSYTCVARMYATNAQKTWSPECFYFGSAAQGWQEEKFRFFFVPPSHITSGNGLTEGGVAAAKNGEYLLYLGVDPFFQATNASGAGRVHNLVVDVQSSSPIRWCLPSKDQFYTADRSCKAFDDTSAHAFFKATTAAKILDDRCFFPSAKTKADSNVGPNGNAANLCVAGNGKGGGEVYPFIAMEDIQKRVDAQPAIMNKVNECKNAQKLYDPAANACK